MKKFLPLLMVLLALTGCDEVKRDRFGGLIGIVGQPSVAFADVDIYDATKFRSLSDSTGLIGTATTGADGRFNYELGNSLLGRPMILVVRPSATTTTYFDYGATGSPDIAFDNQAWVSVIPEWLGGEFACAVNPLTTMAFHALVNIPASEIGSGIARFSSANVNAANSAVATAFGIKADISTVMPTAVIGGGFPASSNTFRQESSYSTSYAYVGVQLAIAGNAFVTATGGGDVLDFYDALFLDARDGVIDGQEFGTPNTYLASALSVVGVEADGSSTLLNWLSTQPLSASEEGFVNSANEGFDPSVATILDLQSTSTGAARVQRIDSFDVVNFPFSGSTVMTIRGKGFRTTDVFEFLSGDDLNGSFTVDREDTGVDGEFQFHSDTELRLLIPDFGATTKSVHGSLHVPSSADFRDITLRMHARPEVGSSNRDWYLELTDEAKVTDVTSPVLVSARIGRVDAGNVLHSVPSCNAVYPVGQDPTALTVGTDDVYELRVRVANPYTDGINGMALDLSASTFEQLGSPVVADVFGGGASGRAIIFEGTLPSVVMAAGDVAELVYRFVFLDTAIGVDLLVGVPVDITPVIAGVSQGTGNPPVTTDDATGMGLTVSIGNADSDQTSEVTVVSTPAMPASISAGQSFDAVIDITAAARTGGIKRDLRIESLILTLALDGETVVVRFSDALGSTAGPAGSSLSALTSQNSSGFPLGISAIQTTNQLTLTFDTDSTRSGTFEITVQVDAIDLATGATSTATSAMATMTVVP
ncbi:hypothetical protein OAU50_05590 [Planctomycetota bacterium]|nr:hypothetical protein [Planctomycetota bacterium]